MTTSTETSLNQKLQQLVDKDEIKEVLYNYGHYLDSNMIPELTALFTEDCYIAYQPNLGAEGIEAYRETLDHEKFGVGGFFAATSHHISNVVITFEDEDTAHSRATLYAWHKYNRDRPDGIVMGQYHDILVRTPDGWKIKRRELKHAGTENYHAKGDSLNPMPRR